MILNLRQNGITLVVVAAERVYMSELSDPKRPYLDRIMELNYTAWPSCPNMCLLHNLYSSLPFVRHH